jgi:hypothetical protein
VLLSKDKEKCENIQIGFFLFENKECFATYLPTGLILIMLRCLIFSI